MTENRVVALRQKGAIDDPLTEILRTGARRLIAQAVEAEFEAFLGSTAELKWLPDGRRRVVRHGHDPVRAIQTRRSVRSKCKSRRPRDRAASGERIRFTSNILPKWARRTKSLDALLPVLYLRGISAGDFQEALAACSARTRPTTFRGGDRAPRKERMGGRISAMAEARFVGALLRLRLGGRRLFAGAHVEPAGRMQAGADRGYAGGQEGTDRLSDGHAGERAKRWKELLVDLKARGPVGPRRRSRHWRWRCSGSGRPSTRRSRRRVISDAGCTRH